MGEDMEVTIKITGGRSAASAVSGALSAVSAWIGYDQLQTALTEIYRDQIVPLVTYPCRILPPLNDSYYCPPWGYQMPSPDIAQHLYVSEAAIAAAAVFGTLALVGIFRGKDKKVTEQK